MSNFICPVSRLFVYNKDWLFWIQLCICIFTIMFGVLLIFQPKKIIELQIALYRPFNWKIEPISMPKEIRNTRIMGAILLLCGLSVLIYVTLSTI